MDLTRDEIIEQSAQVVQGGRLAVLTSADPEQLSMLLGDIAVSMMDAGADVIRVDAFDKGAGSRVIRALCDYLGVEPGELLAGLRIRGETGNPVCLVVDNADCLEDKALDVLQRLLEGTACGVGVLLGGEQEVSGWLQDRGLAVASAIDVDACDPADVFTDEQDDEPAGALWRALPWRHLAAALGLGILVWLFWPSESPSPGTVQALALPEPPARVEPEEKVEPEPAPVVPDSAQLREAGILVDAAPAEQAPAPEVETKPEPKPAPVTPPAPKVAAPTTQAPPPKAAPAPAPAAKPEPSLSGLSAELGYRQEEWLLTQAPGQWVLQVALSATEDGARKLLDQIGHSRSAYYRAERGGKAVYIVLAGPWPDRDRATAGKQSLPASLQALGPFPRELAGIQKEIRAR